MIVDKMSDRSVVATEGLASDRDEKYLAYGKVAEKVEIALKDGREPDLESIVASYPEMSEQLPQLVAALRALYDIGHENSQGSDQPNREILGRLGDFQIIREIGSGGMGVVYEALQISLNRKVAVKVLPLASMMNARQLQRFKTEVQATALLQHPNIVQVYSVGVERSVHFFAMQYVDGHTLAELIGELRRLRIDTDAAALHSADATMLFVDRSPSEAVTKASRSDMVQGAQTNCETEALAALSTEREMKGAGRFERAAVLIAQAAEALDHAHDRGVLHRDVKPSNLMVDATGHLWVTDFGLARLETDTGITMTGDLLGTLRYMSPEQALAQRVIVDQRSDVYSLGATLYELLTLSPAFTGEDRGELLKEIAWEEPRSPRQIDSKVPRDLETITLKAMQKDPNGRYSTAQEMADDLRRFVENKPIQARQPTLANRAVKWARRHQTVVRAAMAVLVFAVIALSVSTVLISAALAETAKQKQTSTRQRDSAVANLYLCHMRMAQQDWYSGQIGRMQGLLDEYLPGSGPDLRGWEWFYLNSLGRTELATLYGHSDDVSSVAWSPDGRRIASASSDGTVKVWDVAAADVLLTLRGHEGEVFQAAWSPRGDRIASCGEDRTVRIWNANNGQEISTLEGHSERVNSVAWGPGGGRLASADRRTIKVWDVNDGTVLMTQRTSGTVVSTAWRSDGRLAWVNRGGAATVWDVAKGAEEATLQLSTSRSDRMSLKSLAWSPDGQQLASVDRYQNLSIWNMNMQQTNFRAGIEIASGHGGSINSVAWNPTGDRIASAAHDGKIKLWDQSHEEEVLTIRAHAGWVNSVSWSPDGRRLASAGADGTVKVWDATKPQGIRTDTGQNIGTYCPTWSPDGKFLAYAEPFGDGPFPPERERIKLFDVNTYQISHSMATSDQTRTMAWDPQSQRLAVGKDNGRIDVLEARTGMKLLSLEAGAGLRSVAWSPQGRLLASAGMWDRKAKVWDTVTGEQRLSFSHSAEVGSVAWSPDGQRLASASWDQVVKVWDLPSGQERFHLVRGKRYPWHGEAADGPYSIAWSPDGRQLAGGAITGQIFVWDMLTGKELQRLEGHTSTVRCVAWSPDGRRIASGSNDRLLKIWDEATGTEVLTLRQPGKGLKSVAWSPDGRRLAAESGWLVHVWDAHAGYRTQ